MHFDQHPDQAKQFVMLRAWRIAAEEPTDVVTRSEVPG
jgi:hypothetical protein